MTDIVPTDPDRMAQAQIDLNADVGEAVTPGGDTALLRLVTSVSVACGLHTGDSHTMRATCAAAAREGVRLGAHVSYDDREGFGRRELDGPTARVAELALALATAISAVAPMVELMTRARRRRPCWLRRGRGAGCAPRHARTRGGDRWRLVRTAGALAVHPQ